MPSWSSELRSKFPALRSLTYLNTATAGPIALEVARAGVEVYESLLGGGDADWERHVALVEHAREALAALVGCTPQELAFTRNTSTSASYAAQILWDAGKRTAVALEDEFPSSTLPFLNRGFDVRFVKSEDGSYDPARIAEGLAGRDVLIASHVMYRTGRVLARPSSGSWRPPRGPSSSSAPPSPSARSRSTSRPRGRPSSWGRATSGSARATAVATSRCARISSPPGSRRSSAGSPSRTRARW